MNDTVGIIIPVYNRLEFLGETIKSVQAQTYTNWELIIVDDGSSEDVRGFINRFDGVDITFIQQNNQGNTAARNKGVEMSHGSYLAFLDSDDIWHPDFLSDCTAVLAQDPQADVVFARWNYIDSQGQVLSTGFGFEEARAEELVPQLLEGLLIYPSASVIRRQVFEKSGGFDTHLDDWDLWLRLASSGVKFVSVNRPLMSYRLHDSNLSRSYEVRRRVHFATLDKFFANDTNQARYGKLQEMAYAQQYRHFAMRAFRSGNVDAGVQELMGLLERAPNTFLKTDLYFEIAAAQCESLARWQPEKEQLSSSVPFLFAVLAKLDSQVEWDSTNLTFKQISAVANLAVGMMYYSYTGEYALARKYLGRSLRLNPALMAQSRLPGFMLRAALAPIAGRRHRVDGRLTSSREDFT